MVKVNSFAQRERAGFTSKAPRWAIAYKYRPEQAETRLRGIVIQVGRTGVLTPVAELDPVFVSGTTVARATLHNEEEIARKDIRIGDLVIVEKAGEVIPAVTGVKKEARTGAERVFKMPETCPVCGGHVVRDPEQVAVRCINAACPAQVRRKFQHFASRGAMDIEGMGEAMVEQLVEHGLARDVSDIYKLTAERLAVIPRTGPKSIENLLDGIGQSRDRPLWRLIFGLGILHVGATGARNLARHFHTIEPMMNATLDELQRIPDVGEIMGRSMFDFFRDAHNRALLERLEAAGLNMGEQRPAPRPSRRRATGRHHVGHHRHALRGARGHRGTDPEARRQSLVEHQQKNLVPPRRRGSREQAGEGAKPRGEDRQRSGIPGKDQDPMMVCAPFGAWTRACKTEDMSGRVSWSRLLRARSTSTAIG